MLSCTLLMKKYLLIEPGNIQNLPQNCTHHVMNVRATSLTHQDKTDSDRFGLAHWSYFNLILTVFHNDMAALVIQSRKKKF